MLEGKIDADFPGLAGGHSERQLKRAVVQNIRRFPVEMGGTFKE
jgi:hypothetical protein